MAPHPYLHGHADAVMRLRAEYQWASKRADDVCFRFTSGHEMAWAKWRRGFRPKVRGNRVRFARSAKPRSSYGAFREYLNVVFTYAGTYSLKKELRPVADPEEITPGDVFIQGGFPGHAVIVVDAAANPQGERVFLLAQSYMPAQQIHVLRNPASSDPWYPTRWKGKLHTPEWTFEPEDLHRFTKAGCPDLRRR